jgi:hypothetical protein
MGKGATNNSAVQFEKEQAAEAKQKEAQRQARLTQGKTLIDQIFEGKPVMQDVTQNFDWGSAKMPTGTAAQQAAAASGNANGLFQGTTDPAVMQNLAGSALPEGYQWIQAAMPQTPQQARDAQIRTASAKQRYGLIGTQGGNQHDKDQWGMIPADTSKTAKAATPSMVWAVKGPDGKIHYQGDQFSYTTQQDTGKKTGGFGDDFFGGYKQKYLDLYNPEETRQFDTASRDLNYNLARSGLGRSSVAADKLGELAYQHALNQAQIVSDASTAEAGLRESIDAQKKAAIDQLYGTEDPSLAANLAQHSADASRLKDPTLTPGASFFAPILSAVGSYTGNQFSPYNYNRNSPGPTVNPSNASSGKGYPDR